MILDFCFFNVKGKQKRHYLTNTYLMEEDYLISFWHQHAMKSWKRYSEIVSWWIITGDSIWEWIYGVWSTTVSADGSQWVRASEDKWWIHSGYVFGLQRSRYFSGTSWFCTWSCRGRPCRWQWNCTSTARRSSFMLLLLYCTRNTQITSHSYSRMWFAYLSLFCVVVSYFRNLE